MTTFAELLVALAVSMLIIPPAYGWDWQDGHATFYGGVDASGTLGGACGYGDLNSEGYGTNTAALSTPLFKDGASCGGCYKIECKEEEDPQWCLPDTSLVVTATNFCPPNYSQPNDDGGWCNPPLSHFDMAIPAFEQIAKYKGGIVPVRFRRVECIKNGGIGFTISGNPYFILVLVSNVGGSGEIVSVSVMSSNSNHWEGMSRNWGQNWQSTNSQLVGKSLSFQITTGDGKTIISYNVAPPDWQFGQTFEGNQF